MNRRTLDVERTFIDLEPTANVEPIAEYTRETCRLATPTNHP